MSPIISTLAGVSARGYGGLLSMAQAGDYFYIDSHTVVGSSTSSVTINVPSTYRHLEMRVMGRNSRPNVNGPNWCNPNNDTNTANYVTQYFYSFGTSSTNIGAAWSNSEGGLSLNSAGSTAASNIYGVATAVILDYNDTDKWKTYIQTGALSNNNSGDEVSGPTAGMWKSTAAITSLVFRPFTSPFTEGTTIAVYGLKG